MSTQRFSAQSFAKQNYESSNSMYGGYSESNLLLVLATDVGAGKSSRMRGNVIWLIAL
jgi:hypothetical protein